MLNFCKSSTNYPRAILLHRHILYCRHIYERNVPANEATAVIVTDTFNPILSNLTVTFNGSTWTEGEDYTYDKTTGTFATGSGKVTVPAATFTVNETTGEWSSNPGFSTLTITGTV